MHVVRSVYICCRFPQQKYRTVLPAKVCAALRLRGRYAASVGVVYIFEHLHTSTVMHYNNSAMYSICFFLRAFALTTI